MQPKPLTKKKSSNSLGLKMLIASSSMALTLGLWGLFSRNQEQSAVTTTDPGPDSGQVAQEDLLGLPPLPTLVPLYTNLSPVAAQNGTNNAPANLSLRVVTAPTPFPTTVAEQPVVQTVILDTSGGASGSSGSGKPAARSRSSRK